MRCLERNKQTFYYALYDKKTPLKDEYGNYSSEYEVLYHKPVKLKANISAAVGEAVTRQFGDDLQYDRVILMEKDSAPIDEYSVLWIDRVPQLDESGELALDEGGNIVSPHDYIVRKVAESLNHKMIAISKVNVR